MTVATERDATVNSLMLRLVLTACLCGACEGRPPSQAGEPEAPQAPEAVVSKAPPNILLVSIDTLRADRLHCYGNPRRTSPTMDFLAENGVLFEFAFAPSPWTLPSHLSLFTGMRPGRFFRGLDVLSQKDQTRLYPVSFRIERSDIAPAEVLRRHGYDTMGFHGGGFVHGRYGLSRGFDKYFETDQDAAFSRASDFVRWRVIEGNERPWFLFVHTYLIHRPYRFELLFGSFVTRPKSLKGMNFHKETLNGRRICPRDKRAALYGWNPGKTVIDYFKKVYDGGVRQVDMMLGMLLETLKDAGWYDNTLIIVVSDHGEEFWDHYPERSPEHNHSLFDELLRVPFLIKFPGNEHAGKRIAQTVRLIDVMPTILEVSGVTTDGLAMHGSSVMPLVTGEGDHRELYAGYTLMGRMRYGVRTDRYKYIFAPSEDGFDPNFDVPREALFDVRADPAETRNIAAANPKVLAQMRAKLRSYRDNDIPYRLVLDASTMGQRTLKALDKLGLRSYVPQIRGRSAKDTAPEPMDPAHLKRLKALGYVE